MNSPFKPTRRFLLSLCIVTSFSVHTGFLAFLQRHSLWFYSHATPHVAGIETPWLQLTDKAPRDKILREAFETPPASEQTPTPLTPTVEPTPLRLTHRSINVPEPSISPPLPLPFPIEQLLAANNDLFPIRNFTLPPLQPLDLFASLPHDLLASTPPEEKTPPEFLPNIENSSSNALIAEAPALDHHTLSASNIPFSEPLVLSAPVLNEVSLPKPATPTLPSPNMPQFPSLSELETVNLSNCFDSEVVFLPREDGPGYIFAITFVAHPDLDLPKLRQNIFFLIDRSNSIQQDRLIASKNAVEKAINELDADDSFNVLIFDSKVEKLFPTLTPATPQAQVRAETFLDKIILGSFFSFPDLYKPLLQTIPAEVQENELYTAILLSDAENLGKKNFQREILHDWSLRNAGRTALYAIGMNSDQHLATLDTVCAFNKGRLYSSSTNRGIKRKLLKLIKNIKYPVAKNLAATAVSRGPSGKIELYPKSSVAPHLYMGQPYVIIGTTETLDDFILFVQGRLKDRWLNIKKNISFLNAKKGGHTLRSEWALKQAYLQYELYVADDNPKHLEIAKSLLEPFDLQAAFE
ncbi:MAG: hypothetical protein KGJ02_00215 [Verrucomicrobiota bacterium]|nr:hypothetical protein [Verrucomicrobiota bacterium]